MGWSGLRLRRRRGSGEGGCVGHFGSMGRLEDWDSGVMKLFVS